MKILSYLPVMLVQLVIGIDCNRESTERCIASKYHKTEPAKETLLHKQCEPWKQYSCCTRNTTIRAHDSLNHYNFDYNHCSEMSAKCKRHFVQDLCFYECEPYLKPWVVKANRSFATERILKVPICSSDCDNWWSDCKNDYTCAHNWARGFNWTKGTNKCKKDSKCKPLKEMFTGAQDFCENVWDHSWKYTKDSDERCMKIWFDGTVANPNKETAEYYASGAQSPLLALSLIGFYYLVLISNNFT